VSTANSAVTTANGAVVTANTANNKADQAIAAVSSSINYTLIANVAAIPASPSNNTYIEISNSTGIESFTPLTGRPAGFVGDSGLTVRLVYTTAGTTWNWLSYFPSNAETRYLKLTGGSLTGAVTTTGTSTAASFIPTSSTAPSNGLYLSGTNTVALATASTGRLFVDASGIIQLPVGEIRQTTDNSLIRIAGGSSTASGARILTYGPSHATNADRLALIAGDAGFIDFRSGGSERMRLDSSGRLGLGTSAPFTTIHSAKSVTGGSPATSGTTDANVIARFQGGSVGFDLGATASGPQWIQPRNVNDLSANYGLSLCPNGGNVGIGVVGPSQKLRVVGDSGSAQFGAGTAGNGVFVNAFDSDTIYMTASATNATQFGIGAASNIPLFFMTNNTERARITSDGKLGLGTSSPGAAFQIVSSTSADQMRIGPNTTEYYKIGRDVTLGKLTFEGVQQSYSGYDFKIYPTSGSAATSALVIKEGSGNVGIGTTAPQALCVISNAGANGLEISPSASSGTASLIQSYNRSTSAYSILNYAAAQHLFTDGTNEKARIDSSGRLLVGTSSSLVAKYDSSTFEPAIQCTGTQGTGGFYRYSNDADPPAIVLSKSRSGTIGTQSVISNGDTLGYLGFAGSDGSAFQTAATIRAQVDGTPGTDDMPGRLVFSTTADGASSPTERMRINNSGQTGVFCSSANAFYVSSSGSASASDISIVTLHSAVGVYTGTVSFIVRTNGNVENTNNSYGAISDIKLKENIVDANSQWDDLKALQVRNYNFKEGQTHTQIGLIAQEVELVSPGLVSESPDRDQEGNDLGTVTKSVNYSVLYMKAVKALQEAMERIETLEAKVAALEAS
jgi:hypothetical protein